MTSNELKELERFANTLPENSKEKSLVFKAVTEYEDLRSFLGKPNTPSIAQRFFNAFSKIAYGS